MDKLTKKYMQELLKGVDIKGLENNVEKELKKFRKNIARMGQKILKEKSPSIKERIVKGLTSAGFELIARLPVVTPSITPFLQSVTAEDLGYKIDTLGTKIDTLGTKIDTLGTKIDIVGTKIDHLGVELGTKIDNGFSLLQQTILKMTSLQEKTLSLQEKTLSLQEKTLQILDERLSPVRST